MTIDQFKKIHSGPLRQATLLFIHRPDQILLAMKKRGFGAGKWNGVGGKVEPGETILQAALREAREEIGVEIEGAQQIGALDFYFQDAPADQNWNQRVHVFLADIWSGDPTETDEMAPQWFQKTVIPWQQMWPDDPLWLPRVLAGEIIYGEFLFGPQEAIIDHHVASLSHLDEMPSLPF